MVKSSGIREKLRSRVLDDLAKERGIKRLKDSQADKTDSESEDDEETKMQRSKRLAGSKSGTKSLLSLLPRPKHSSAFGPTVRLDKLLKMPEREKVVQTSNSQEDTVERLTEDGLMEVDVSKVVGDVSLSQVKELTVEKMKPNAVIVPKGKEKQKNQITYLAQLGKANELRRKEEAAQSRINKAAARSKYGW